MCPGSWTRSRKIVTYYTPLWLIYWYYDRPELLNWRPDIRPSGSWARVDYVSAKRAQAQEIYHPHSITADHKFSPTTSNSAPPKISSIFPQVSYLQKWRALVGDQDKPSRGSHKCSANTPPRRTDQLTFGTIDIMGLLDKLLLFNLQVYFPTNQYHSASNIGDNPPLYRHQSWSHSCLIFSNIVFSSTFSCAFFFFFLPSPLFGGWTYCSTNTIKLYHRFGAGFEETKISRLQGNGNLPFHTCWHGSHEACRWLSSKQACWLDSQTSIPEYVGKSTNQAATCVHWCGVCVQHKFIFLTC